MKIFHAHFPNILKLVLLCLLLVIVPTLSHARDVAFTWTANSESLLTGYKLYYKTGTEGEPYDGTGLNGGDDSPILLGNVTSATVTGLSPDETYHFAIKAYYEDNESGDYSTTITILPETLPAPTINFMSQN